MPSGGPRPQRTNTTPKPVSGPGRLSQRTDMIPSGGAYGDRKDIQGLIAAGNRATPQPSRAVPKITGIMEPTERPQEPVTAGNMLGAGPGMEALNLPKRSYDPKLTLSRLAQSDPTGKIEMILKELENRGL
jgi:hypothetical protein